MAVDFAVPLITNVKNAKMLVEALVRKLPLDVSAVDAKSSHTTHIFPGLINISSFVSNISAPGSNDLAISTQASISSGFTTSIVLPIGQDNMIFDRDTLKEARSNVNARAHCNYSLGFTATPDNIQTLDDELQAEAKFLFVPFGVGGAPTPLAVAASHFSSWPIDKPIVSDAKGSDLASVLLLASLHNRSIHITDVCSKEDLDLISLSKARQLKVTCDVSVYSLFFTREQYPKSTTLPSEENHNALWKRLDTIDAFSVGMTPFRLASEVGEVYSPWSGTEETLPLLLTAVEDGRLTLEDIRLRLHDNPIHIFGLPDQANTHVEVVIGRKAVFGKRPTCWSTIEQTSVAGAIHRVVVHGQTVFLDGHVFSSPQGKDISSATVTHPTTSTTAAALGAITAQGRDDHLPSLPALSSGQPLGVGLHGPLAPSLHLPHQPHPAFHRRHILSVRQFSHRDIHDLFSLAHEMQLQVERNGTLDILKGKVLCTLFYEPSTRTSSSFDAAMKRCGGEVVQINAELSSVQKGETLPDTVRTLGCYGDAIVLRHPDVGSAQLAAKFSPVPIINAGDGIGEHPTQVGTLLLL